MEEGVGMGFVVGGSVEVGLARFSMANKMGFGYYALGMVVDGS